MKVLLIIFAFFGWKQQTADVIAEPYTCKSVINELNPNLRWGYELEKFIEIYTECSFTGPTGAKKPQLRFDGLKIIIIHPLYGTAGKPMMKVYAALPSITEPIQFTVLGSANTQNANLQFSDTTGRVIHLGRQQAGM